MGVHGRCRTGEEGASDELQDAVPLQQGAAANILVVAEAGPEVAAVERAMGLGRGRAGAAGAAAGAKGGGGGNSSGGGGGRELGVLCMDVAGKARDCL